MDWSISPGSGVLLLGSLFIGNIANCVNLESAVERGTPGLHPGSGWEGIFAGEIAAIDAVEGGVIPLVFQPHCDFE